MKSENHKKGFTLIELAAVIIILALLALFAIPRYLKMLSEARTSLGYQVNTVLQSALALTRMRAKLEGDTGAGTVTLEKGEGGTETVTTTSKLVPTATATGIGRAIDLRDLHTKLDIAYTDTPLGPIDPGSYNAAIFRMAGASDPDTCYVQYIENTTTGASAISRNLAGC